MEVTVVFAWLLCFEYSDVQLQLRTRVLGFVIKGKLDLKLKFCCVAWLRDIAACSLFLFKQQEKNIQRNLQSNDANKLAKLYFFSYP